MKYIKFLLIFILSLTLTNCEDKKKKNLLPIQNQILNEKKATIAVANPTASTASLNETAPAVTGIYETEVFSYQTMRVVTIDATVVDGSDQPITGAIVEIRDTSNTNTIYQQVSNSSGRVQGSLNLNTTETTIYVYVIYRGVSTPAKAVVVRNGDNKVLVRITQIKIDVSTSVLTSTGSGSTGTSITDSDGDGVLDSIDDYPNDPNKAKKLKFPTTGVNTIAFEDLFPTAGDADLNDTVIVYYIEEDLNAAGQIVEIRGNYQYMAHGSGFKHSLYLRLPITVNVTYSSEVRNGNGVTLANAAMTKSTTEATGINSFTPSVTDLQDGLRILGNTDTTIGAANWNTRTTDTTYANGHMAKVKVTFTTPVARSVLGLAPYDTFIRLESKAVNGSYPADAPRSVTTAGSFQVYEVHRPGFYKYASQVTVDGDLREIGEDLYIDKNNFPFGVVVPGLWKWPRESRDLRNLAQTGYAKFANWTGTAGVQDANWYADPTAATTNNNYYANVVTNKAALDAPNSQLLAFLGGVSLASKFQVLLAILVFSLLSYFVVRNKFKKA
jgi:LruC domain-containing protein